MGLCNLEFRGVYVWKCALLGCAVFSPRMGQSKMAVVKEGRASRSGAVPDMMQTPRHFEEKELVSPLAKQASIKKKGEACCSDIVTQKKCISEAHALRHTPPSSRQNCPAWPRFRYLLLYLNLVWKNTHYIPCTQPLWAT